MDAKASMRDRVMHAVCAYGIGVALAAIGYGLSSISAPAYAGEGASAPEPVPAQPVPAQVIEQALTEAAFVQQSAEAASTESASDTDAGICSDEAPQIDTDTTPQQTGMQDVQQPAPLVADAQVPFTLTIKGMCIPYIIDLQGIAPATGAALWDGSDSTTDGAMGYFVGHNPGDFWGVAALGAGDSVGVCDSAGRARTYTVVDIFDVAPGTLYARYADGTIEVQYQDGTIDTLPLSANQESIMLQTCSSGAYRIVVAL